MLKKRAFNATLWSGADVLVRQGLQFAITVALARMLTPGDFGTVALLGLFTAVASAFADGGFSAALIQRQDTNKLDESTAFWCNLAIGGVMTALLVVLAPAIAAFYQVPMLDSLMKLMALSVLLSALGAVHLALLRKRLQFRRQMFIGAAAAIVSGAIAVGMALHGYGASSLATQIVATNAVATLLLWITGRWWPSMTFSTTSLRRLFGFGGYYMGANLLDVTYSRIYTMVIGKYFGPRALGYYANAESNVQLPGGFLTGVFGRVVFPMFSATTDDPALLRRGNQFALRSMTLLSAPMLLGLAALSAPFVRTVFGDQWLPAAPLLSVLCLAALFTPMHVINTHVLLAHGHSRRLFHIEVAKKLLGLALMIVGAQFGLVGIAWSQVIYSIISFLLTTRYTASLVGYGAASQLRDAAPTFAIGIGMAALIAVLNQVWKAPAPVTLVVLSFVGAAFFALTAWTLRIDAARDVLSLVHMFGGMKTVVDNERAR